jgi:hypothetical protein
VRTTYWAGSRAPIDEYRRKSHRPLLTFPTTFEQKKNNPNLVLERCA